MFTSIGKNICQQYSRSKLKIVTADLFKSQHFGFPRSSDSTIYMRNSELIMIFLKEPGYYKDNDFGIRIEDIAVIVPVNTKVGTK